MSTKSTTSTSSATKARLSRRQVLEGSSALAAATLLGCSEEPRREAAGEAAPRPRDVLVNIFLRGGIDALGTVVPFGEGEYYTARPTLAVPPPGEPGGAVDLDGVFGLHPAAAPLHAPFREERLAIVHATGSPDPTRSHFDGFARMEFGEPNMSPGTLTNGWLARMLIQSAAQAAGPLRGIAAGDYLPRAMAGAPSVLPITDLSSFAFPGRAETARARAAVLREMYGAQPPPTGPTARDTFIAIERMRQVDFTDYAPAAGARYPASPLGQRLRHTAALIKAGIGVEVVNVDYGDWDDHFNQAEPIAARLDDLARSLAAFDVDTRATSENVVVVCMSEFGRRLAENSSQGTDHGHGGLMLVMGPGIRGGRVVTDWPGLAPEKLDSGDLAITIDYRDVLGELLDRRLGATDIAEIFPQHAFTSHGLTA